MLDPQAPTIVFDLDGTLADTAVDLVATLNMILAREALPPLPLAQAREMIGAGAKALIQRGLAANGRSADRARLDQLFEDFLAHYGENLAVETRLYPGVSAALDRLAAAGWRLAVCTNKMTDHAVRLLDALDVGDRFAAICGRDAFPFHKPDPRHLNQTVERAGGLPRKAVMVGDSRTDIETAKAAGIPVIAVTFGYTDQPVAELGPERVIEHFDALAAAVAALERNLT